MGEHLPFIIRRSSPVQIIASYRGLKRRRVPLRKRVRGLDVVMTVDEHRGPLGRTPPVGVDNRMGGSGNALHLLHPNAPQLLRQPLCAAPHVACALRLRTHAGETDKIHQLCYKTWMIGVSTGERPVDGLHSFKHLTVDGISVAPGGGLAPALTRTASVCEPALPSTCNPRCC